MHGLQQTLRQTYQTMFSLPVLIIWTAGWVIGAVAGPFGTFETMQMLPRMLYWVAISGFSIVFGYLGFGIAIWQAGRSNLPRQAWLGALLSTLLVAPVVWAVTALSELTGNGTNPGIWAVMFDTALLCSTVAVLRLLLQRLLAGHAPKDQQQVCPRLISRLPAPVRGPVLRLSAADHVVQVVTDNGSCDLRMRFSDAINEMDGITGCCTHRSHWVAEAAICGARREAGRWVIELRNGDTVPVSRKYQPDLEKAGLLKAGLLKA